MHRPPHPKCLQAVWAAGRGFRAKQPRASWRWLTLRQASPARWHMLAVYSAKGDVTKLNVMGRRMRIKPLLLCACFLAVVSVAVISQRSAGQSTVAPSLITQPIDEGKLVVLRGNTHPLARAKYDQGAAPGSLAMDHMMLVLKTTSAQGTALETLLAQQQDRSSPNYHKWLTPQEFGEQFGASESDVQKIASWLQSHGFQVDNVANGRNVIQFSGNAGQVQSAFHTAIHNYTINSKQHWANASDPSIPAALTPAVAGIAGTETPGARRVRPWT